MARSRLLTAGRLATAAWLCAGVPAPLAAQVEWSAHLGAAASSALVNDQVVSPLAVAPAIAPVLLLGGSIPMDDKGRRFGIEAGLASGSYASKENGTSTDLGTLRTLSATAGVDGPMAASLRWRVGLGFLAYLPAERTGIFQDGAPMRLLGGAGLEYRRRLRASWMLTAVLRYEFHRFTTAHLQSQGFTGSEDVHRLTLGLGISR